MLLTDLWKERMINTLQMVYNNGLNEKALNKYLNDKIANIIGNTPKMLLRDVYKDEYFEEDLNNVLNIVEKRNLTIVANGAFTYSAKEKLSDVSEILMNLLEGRKREKKLIFECESKGLTKEAALHDTLQTYMKQNINSFYGVCLQGGNILNNPDAGAGITAQSQNLTSEMMWTIERFLGNNMQLNTLNEALLYYKGVIDEKHDLNSYNAYLSYIPSKNDLYRKLLKDMYENENFYDDTKEVSKSLFLWITNLNDEESIYLYYKNNLVSFLTQNTAIFSHFRAIMSEKELFLDPYSVPPIYKPDLDKIIDILSEFVVHHCTTYNRKGKYINSKRDVCIISDTDSIYVSLDRVVRLTKAYCNGYLNLENTEEEINMKIINVWTSIVATVISRQCDYFVKQCNTEIIYDKYKISMKNEYYFKKILIINGVKKNYATYTKLREGRTVPEHKQISYTGIKLNSSRIPKDIVRFQSNLIENFIMKAPKINPVAIITEINRFKVDITNEIRNGNKNFGIPLRFSGVDNYKTPESIAVVGIVESWNRLYPNDLVLAGDQILTFDAKVYKMTDLHLIKDERWREMVKKNIFCDYYNGIPNLIKNRGLKTVGIPKDGDTYTIPPWMIDIIDIELHIKKLLQNISDFLPSLGISSTRLSSNDKRYSTLLQF
jgi:hypothetical protein